MSTEKIINYDIILVEILFFEIHGIGWNLSMTRTSYKLTKKTTKTGKIEKYSKMYNIKCFKTVRYKLTASGNILHLMGNYNFLRPFCILRLPKEFKKQKQQIEKKLSERTGKAFRERIFQY